MTRREMTDRAAILERLGTGSSPLDKILAIVAAIAGLAAAASVFILFNLFKSP